MAGQTGFRVQGYWILQAFLCALGLATAAGAFFLAARMKPAFILAAILPAALTWFFVSLARSYIAVDSQAIMVQFPYGQFKMFWEDIERVVTNGFLFSFQGGEKQLFVSMVVVGKGKREFYRYLVTQIQARSIALVSARQVSTAHRNTRVKHSLKELLEGARRHVSFQ
jgi:hypothetical protein